MTTGFSDEMRLAVFASGGGTNFQAILDAVARGDLPARVVLCLTNRSDAGALDRAHAAGVPTFVVPADASTPETQGAVMLEALASASANFIALAGYVKMIPEAVVHAFRSRIVNIHPALLPAFGGRGMYGHRVHEAVLEHGVKWTGVTVHVVDEAYDTGPIVLQEPVPVAAGDTAESLAGRVLEAEHRLYPEALRLFAEGRVRVEGRHVRIVAHGHKSNS